MSEAERRAQAVRQMQLFGVRGHLHMALTAATQAEQRILANPGNVLPDGLVLALTLAHADRAAHFAIKLLGGGKLASDFAAYRTAYPEVVNLRDAVEHFDTYLKGKGWKQLAAKSSAARKLEKTGLSIISGGEGVTLRVGPSWAFGEDLIPFEVNASEARVRLAQLGLWARLTAAVREEGG